MKSITNCQYRKVLPEIIRLKRLMIGNGHKSRCQAHDCQFKAYLTKNTNSHKFTDHTHNRQADRRTQAHEHTRTGRQTDRQTRVHGHTWRIRYVN